MSHVDTEVSVCGCVFLCVCVHVCAHVCVDVLVGVVSLDLVQALKHLQTLLPVQGGLRCGVVEWVVVWWVVGCGGVEWVVVWWVVGCGGVGCGSKVRVVLENGVRVAK